MDKQQFTPSKRITRKNKIYYYYVFNGKRTKVQALEYCLALEKSENLISSKKDLSSF